jgi:PPOX class probable FMN-dependent enzyme
VVGTLEELRTMYRAPGPVVQSKKAIRLDDASRNFIAGSPFCLLATSDADGNADVSPRGGPRGFVRVLDEQRVALPDLSGNNLLDSLTNIVANPHAGLLFIIPGRDETLRVEGRAVLTREPEILALWDDELRTPKVAVGIEVRTAYMHCAKSFRRGRVWDAASWSEYDDVPDGTDLLLQATGLEISNEDLRKGLEAGYENDLTNEKA